MAPSPLQQRRTHNTLLFQKLLNLRDGASPFTLVLDSLEQGSGCVVKEFVRRAQISKSKIIFVSYTTLRKKLFFEPDVFISARTKGLSALRNEILSHYPAPTSATPIKTLIIIDSLSTLCSKHPSHLSTFLSSLLTAPTISLLATLHTDIPLPTTPSPYQPSTLTTLTYLATAILTISSFPHVLSRKRARDKSLPDPVFGLDEGKEGLLIGLKTLQGDANANALDGREKGAVVVNMEIRRRSGRGVVEDFVLVPPTSVAANSNKTALATIVLLDEHPLYTSLPLIHTGDHAGPGGSAGDEEELTFNLGLTEKQKRDREGVVLPYFDAQKGAGPGEGGRILYEMGAEDREDFDDEEDEI